MLNPEIVSSHRFQYYAKYDNVLYPKIVTYWNSRCDVDNLPEHIPYPFEGVFTLVTKQFITIIGDDFEYRFPVNLLMSIWERFTSKFEEDDKI